MTTSRRTLLGAMAAGGAVATRMIAPVPAFGQEASGVTARIRRDLERHASFGDKFSGGPGDNATADWIAERLRDGGYAVEESEFDAPFFERTGTHLSLDGTSIDVIAQAPVVPTDASGITAPLALVDGAVGDVRGRIALVIAPFGRHAALFPDRGVGQAVTAAARAGAAGIVISTTGPTGEAHALNAPEEPFVPVPTAVIAPKDVAPFVAAAAEGREATLVLDGNATHRPCRNIVARIRRGNRWLVISTPRSGWYGCVAERGTGTAAFLELADWAPRRFPDLSIFLMNTGGHEYFFAGSHRVVGEAPPPADTLVWVHVGATLAIRDSVQLENGQWQMLDTADPERRVMATEPARGAVVEAFRGLSGLEEPAPVQPQAGELSSFTDRGYRTAFAVIAAHRWFHTPLDTLDLVDARLVTPVLEAHQRAIELLVSRA